MKEIVRFSEGPWEYLRRIARTCLALFRRQETLGQMWNHFRCKMSMRRLSPRPWGKPHSLLLEPTSACNLRCPLCPTGLGALNRPSGMMEMDVYRSIINQCRSWVSEINLSNYGEPLLHRDIVEMIRLAKDARIRVTVASNLHALTTDDFATRLVDSGMDYIYISLDGVDQESYADYRRNGNFEKVCEAIRRLVRAKRSAGSETPFIELQYLVMRHNEDKVDTFRRIAGDLGVDGIALKPMSFNNADWDDAEVLAEFRRRYPQNQEFHLYDVDENQIRWKPTRVKPVCLAPWYTLTILWDGRIVPCCLDPRANLVLGTVQDGILEAWYGRKAMHLRETLRTQGRRMPLCARCCGI